MEIRHNDTLYRLEEMSLHELRELEHILRSEIVDIQLQLSEATRLWHEEGLHSPREWRNKANAAIEFKKAHVHLLTQHIKDIEQSNSEPAKLINKALKAVWDYTYMCNTPDEYQWLLNQIVILLHGDMNDYDKWVKAYHYQQDNWSIGIEPDY